MSSVKEFVRAELGSTEINISEEEVLHNISVNIRRQLPQVNIVKSSPKRVCLVAGGPSLNKYFPALLRYFWKGQRIFAMNGSALWLLEHNVCPHYQIIVDGRSQNKVFVEQDIPNCTYLLASHVHPSVFDACEGRNVYIFHTAPREIANELLTEYYFDTREGHTRWQWINAGSTVGLGAIGLARCLGFPFLNLFGYDSCCYPAPEDRDELDSSFVHHAYPQQMNDKDRVLTVRCGDREFLCTPWQMRQADNFYLLLDAFGKYFSIRIYGDGLLAHIIQTRSKPWIQGEADAA